MEVASDAAAPAADSVRRQWAAAAAVAGGVFCLYLLLAASSTIWDRDEARFSRATAEMVRSGNYLYPTFDDRLRPDKPIFIYWLMALPLRLFGVSALACRLVSVTAAALSCFLTYVIGRKLFGHRSGVWAMLILATAPLFTLDGTTALADATLLASILAVFALLAGARDSGLRAAHVAGLAAAFAAGMLTKGILAEVVVLLTVGVWFCCARGALLPGRGTPLKIAGAALLGALAFLAWFVLADRATGGEFGKELFGHHHFDRVTEPLEHHGGNVFVYLPYYFGIVLLFFFPWTLFLPGAIAWLLRQGRAKWFLAGWAVPTFALMTCVATKLPHYVLPIWPALALAVGAVLEAARESRLSARELVWLKRGVWLFVPAGAAAAAALVAAPEYFNLAALWPAAIVLGALAVAVTALAAWQQLHGRIGQAAATVAAGALAFQLATALLLLPQIERFKASAQIAALLDKSVEAQTPLMICVYDEPSLFFCTFPRPVQPVANKAAVREWAAGAQPGVLLISRPVLQQMPLPRMREIGAFRNYNYTKGNWEDLVVLVRENPAPKLSNVRNGGLRW